MSAHTERHLCMQEHKQPAIVFVFYCFLVRFFAPVQQLFCITKPEFAHNTVNGVSN